MITVQTASRLHFGMLSFPVGSGLGYEIGRPITPPRAFGGVGLMIQRPGVALRLRPANELSARGPLADSALSFARCFVDSLRNDHGDLSRTIREQVPDPHEIIADHCSPEHAGLGTGTQLALAVARGLSEAWNFPLKADDLCLRVGRGKRSALGCHGFFQGGFIVEAGQRFCSKVGGSTGVTAPEIPSEISPLVARLPFPEEWRIVLIIPSGNSGLHGDKEGEAFQQLLARGFPLKETESLCRLVLLGLLPSIIEHDCKAFGEALYEFNQLAGQPFANFQGGTYASPLIAELIQSIRQSGVSGVGQSSWGPAVYAIVEDEARSNDLADKLRRAFSLQENEIIVTRACNHGAVVSEVKD